ncbi:M14 family metallopeptidase [Urechidicola vernalis]|uniref:M14 family metallopeptidase n=1 Tax=Urechidicola vernalis TaxID=3075600 RepID=A0ABU2Y5R0_9FLAO|nr:M14 family metallopeptidase [Urechidicola sp. P050]MDT0552403.1 M14 family metallopeptidase [Urechidicola sp. P050]
MNKSQFYSFLIVLFLTINSIAQTEEVVNDSIPSNPFETAFEQSGGTQTATYEQTILFYENLANKYPEITIRKIGKTDSGHPLLLIIFDNGQVFNPIDTEKTVVLINNGIHPGEPDGIDASMMALRDIAENDQLKYTYNNIMICVIPIYNVGGSLNRNSGTRANQNGPESYGFRGNALNYDLNRDFVKNDTKNSQAFTKLFHLVNPDIFVDNHVSNGADYQYTLTHLFTQHNKLGGKIGDYLHHKMMPDIEEKLIQKGHAITPYVNVFNSVPEKGFSQFFDSPRYSTGYTTLFNTFGLMVETHMLKPYKQRVEGTYDLMFSVFDFAIESGESIKYLRSTAADDILSNGTYPVQWKLDSTKTRTLSFEGYEGSFIKSEITGQKRLKYDSSQPFTKPVTYYDNFKATKEVLIPKYYVVPKVLTRVVERLKLNNIEMHPLKSDIAIEVESYKIKDYETGRRPYEGHYLHKNTEIESTIRHQKFNAGDFLIPTNQPGIRYLIEVLEPEATDSFFNWNFFDVILQQKEHFSPYVFEDLALKILEDNQQLKTAFELKKEHDEKFASNWYAQLNYIYENSNHAEKSYLQYPIYRILE